MKSTGDRPLKLLFFVYRGFIVFLALLGLVFIIGTIYGVFFYNSPTNHFQMNAFNETEEGQIFTGIGLLRVSTADQKSPLADPQPGMVILFVSFIYNPNDKAFFEELVLRVRDFREIIVDYLGSFLVSELQMMNEESIKTELLHRFNAVLRLGQIESLYFSDFMIVG